MRDHGQDRAKVAMVVAKDLGQVEKRLAVRHLGTKGVSVPMVGEMAEVGVGRGLEKENLGNRFLNLILESSLVGPHHLVRVHTESKEVDKDLGTLEASVVERLTVVAGLGLVEGASLWEVPDLGLTVVLEGLLDLVPGVKGAEVEEAAAVVVAVAATVARREAVEVHGTDLEGSVDQEVSEAGRLLEEVALGPRVTSTEEEAEVPPGHKICLEEVEEVHGISQDQEAKDHGHKKEVDREEGSMEAAEVGRGKVQEISRAGKPMKAA